MSSPTPEDDIPNAMDVVEIFADHEQHEGARVTLQDEATGERVVVSLFQSHTPQQAGVDRLIHLIAQSLATEDYDEQQALEDEALGPIFEAAAAAAAAAAAKAASLVVTTTTDSAAAAAAERSTPTTRKNLSLHDVLFPKASYYRLEATTTTTTTGDDGHAGYILVPTSADEAYGGIADDDNDDEDGMHDMFDVDPSLPRYPSTQIRVVEELVGGGGTVCLVEVETTTTTTAAAPSGGGGPRQRMLCKARRDGLADSNLEREVDCLQKISRAYPRPPPGSTHHACGTGGGGIRVPALLGYVESPKSGRGGGGKVLGLLREWIPSKTSLKDAIQEQEEDGVSSSPSPSSSSKEAREKWARQVRDTVGKLHQAGVVWGDAKPGNVVVDLGGDAWLIDFGGGWSAGWVDEDLQETVAGDEQAVARITEYLLATSTRA